MMKRDEALQREIQEKVDRLAYLTGQQDAIKKEAEAIKAWFEANATEELKDTKSKTVEYWGTANAKVTVGTSSTVKPVSLTMVRKLLGAVYADFVKEETAYKMTEPCKRLLGMMFLGEYTEGSVDEAIRGITADEKTRRVLKKKLKGRYAKDKEVLIRQAGLAEQEAGDWAYLLTEVFNWEWLLQVLQAAGWQGTPQEAVDLVNAAVVVDEGLKVAVDAE